MIATADEQARRLENVAQGVAQLLSAPMTTSALKASDHQDEWSVMELLGHLVEMIPYWLHSCQTILAADHPPTFGRSLEAPERLDGVKRGATLGLPTALAQLQAEIQQGTALIRGMSDEQRRKKGNHLVRGELTVGEIIETLIVAHAEAHLAQLQSTVAKQAQR